MNETSLLEKQLHSWTPRRPSDKIARRLFSASAATRTFASLWQWMTPVAVCAFTVVVAVQTSSRESDRSAADHAMSRSGLPMTGEFSNAQPTFVLTELDANTEWNVWPHISASAPTNR